MSKEQNTFIAGKKNEGKFYGGVEVWTFAKKGVAVPYTSKTVTVGGKDKTVGNMTVTAPMHPSSAKYYFGEEFIPEEGKSVFIDVVAWERVAEQLAKYNPTLKQKLMLVGEIEVQEYKTKAGTEGKKLVMNLDGFKPLTKKKGIEESQDSQEPVSNDFEEVQNDGDLPF